MTSTRTPPETRPTLRLRGSTDMLDAVPHLLGFVPTDSLVVVGVVGPRSRVGPALRLDLGNPREDRELARHVAELLRGHGLAGALTIVYDDGPAPEHRLPRRGLVTAVERALRREGIAVRDALLVRRGRWWSYRCQDPRCCPPEGAALPAASSTSVVGATLAVEQGLPLPSREALVASLGAAVPAGLAAEVAALLLELAARPPAHRLARLRAELPRAVAAVEDGPGPGRAQVSALIALVQDIACRDEVVLSADPAELGALVRLWSLLLRQAPPRCVPEVGAVLAGLAQSGGQGALARTAVDRVLAADPAHRLGLLLLQVLDAGLAPLRGPDLGGGDEPGG